MRSHFPNRPAQSTGVSGFTLIEMLIVLGIIALLAGIVVVNIETFFGGAQESTAQTYVTSSLSAPLLKYRIDTGSYPTTQEGLEALLTAPANKAAKWKGPYVDDLPDDPWGRAYQYRYPGTKDPTKFDLYSLGPDGTQSDDDIGNWN